MKIRVISDLHLDINRRYPFSYPACDDTFTIICGDTSGNPTETAKWISQNIKQGIFIIGNHYGYHPASKPLEKVHQYLKRKFPLKSSVAYLNNAVKIIDDTVFFGATLWTDFRYGASDDEGIRINMNNAFHTMNDFRHDMVLRNNRPSHIAPMDMVLYFDETIEKLRKTIKRYPDKKTVVVTHHAPHPKSISVDFINSPLNAAFVSDLSDLILASPNIRLWCHGHVHHPVDYMIGQCQVICNPRGYIDWDRNLGFEKNLLIEI